MPTVVPCVTATTPDEYKASLERVYAFTTHIHVDVSDGSFAPTALLGVDQIWWPQDWTADVHVMAAEPSQYIDRLISKRPHMITLHAEAKEDIVPLLQRIKQYDIRAGVSLMRSTVPSTVVGLLGIADHVMIFSGDLGKYGGTASLMQLEKIRLIKNINNGIEIGWDGGINIDNIFSLVQGGVEVLNVGGAIQNNDDAPAAYRALVAEVTKQGVAWS
ncbi:MAG: hypothetical protein WAS27_03125 [Candidatus Saccharimonadales bacterium]